MKRLVSKLTLVFLIGCINQNVWAFTDTTANGIPLYYSINSDGVTVTLFGHGSPCSGALVIPDSINYNGIRYAVIFIGENSFQNCSGLTSVTIPNTIVEIGINAFKNCLGLTSIIIPNSVTYIGDYAFGACNGLTSVVFNADSCVTGYNSKIFPDCNNITSFLFGNNVKSIPDFLCWRISGLTSVTIPDSVKHIGVAAFCGCSGLISVIIPNSVTNIGGGAFSYCTGLISVTIPNSVTSIGYEAFYECSSILDTLDIPSSVIQIGNNAFYNVPCIRYEGTAGGTPWGALSMATYIEDSLIYTGPSKFKLIGCVEGIQNAIVPNTVTSIDGAFDNCTTLKSVLIPNSVVSIGPSSFNGCTRLDSVMIPNSVKTIGGSAFRGCSSLKSITIPDSVTVINSRTFEYCTELKSVIIPNSVTSIYDRAFFNCESLESVTIPESVSGMSASAFYMCSNITTVYCKAIAPPYFTYPGFNANNYYFFHQFNQNVTKIFVPCASIDAYINYGSSYGGWYQYHLYGITYIDDIISFVSNNDTMGTVDVGLVDCDSNITVSAIANEGFRFVGWSDGDSVNPRTLHINGDTTLTAIFDNYTYSIVGQTSDTTRGFVSGGDTINYGDTISLLATSNYGYHFSRWNDFNMDNPRTIIATDNATYTAYFQPDNYRITVLSSDPTQGSVYGSGNAFYQGDRYIYATPATGYHFSHWSDGDSNATRYIIIESDTTLTAFFEINSYVLDVISSDTTLGMVTGGGVYNHGEQVTVTATPFAGKRFSCWSDNTTQREYILTLTSDLHLAAIFVPVDSVWVHDTTIVVDTLIMTEYVPVHDTTYFDVFVHDTTIVDNWIYDTTYLWQYDTTYIDNYIHDTTIVNNWIYDTTIVVDTLWLTQFDTVWLTLYDTVWLHDTLIVHDTIYITQEGIGNVEMSNIKLYQRNGQIVVEGAEGYSVTMYDISGRKIAETHPALRAPLSERGGAVRSLQASQSGDGVSITFDVPASGAYLLKIGNLPARKVVVIR